MRGKKYAHPTVLPAGWAVKNGNHSTIPHGQHTTFLEETRHLFISNFLMPGEKNALRLSELVQLTHLDGRTLRRAIHEERKLGFPIVSDCRNGYFLAASEYDLLRFRHSMQHRAGEILKVVQATDDLLERMTGQLRIGG